MCPKQTTFLTFYLALQFNYLEIICFIIVHSVCILPIYACIIIFSLFLYDSLFENEIMSYVPQNLLQANPTVDSPGEAPQGSPSKSRSEKISKSVLLLLSQLFCLASDSAKLCHYTIFYARSSVKWNWGLNYFYIDLYL